MEEIMKRIRTLLLVSLMTLSIAALTACGRNNDAVDNGNGNGSTTESGVNNDANTNGTTDTNNDANTNGTTGSTSSGTTNNNTTGSGAATNNTDSNANVNDVTAGDMNDGDSVLDDMGVVV